jgi:predicted ribosomally synthesized peptide with nif11-like leader
LLVSRYGYGNGCARKQKGVLTWLGRYAKLYCKGAMREEQLSAFLVALKADSGLQEKLKGAADLDAALATAKGAGFDVNKADLLSHQARTLAELNDKELERVAGGAAPDWAVSLMFPQICIFRTSPEGCQTGVYGDGEKCG